MNMLITLWLASGGMRQYELPAADCLLVQSNAAAGWKTEVDDLPANSTDHVIKVTCTPPRTDNLY